MNEFRNIKLFKYQKRKTEIKKGKKKKKKKENWRRNPYRAGPKHVAAGGANDSSALKRRLGGCLDCSHHSPNQIIDR
jgi:hypothetical protein